MVELSSLDVHALARELRDLEDAFIDKAYQTGPEEIVLKLRQPQRGAVHLLVRVGQFVARVQQAPETPEAPSTFAMLLRKHLANARIRRIDQHEFDRVLRLRLERGGEPLELVVELFGKGNLILAGPDGKIVLSMRTETFAHRTIKRGEALVFPPPRVNPLTLPRSEFERLVAASEKDLVRFLALDAALGGDLAEEVVHRSGVEKGRRARQMSLDEVERVWTALREVVDSEPQPAILSTVKGPQVSSLPYRAPLFRDAQREPTASLSEAIRRVSEAEAQAVEPKEDQERARLERQVQHQERGIKELEQEAAAWERRGHLVFAHYANVLRAIQKAKASVEAMGWGALEKRHRSKSFEGDSWLAEVSGIDGKRARILVPLEGEEVPLDPLESVEHNATVLYDESKRIRAKAVNARNALEETRRKLAQRAAGTAAKPAAPRTARAPAKRFWFEAHRWFYSSEGFLIVAGRDAGSNEKLVKRHLAAGDRYVHADFPGAPSCIVKGEGRMPGEPTMREACQFGVTYSRAFSQFATADAYWVQPEQVSKTGESGEYVPRGSFVIRGARNYQSKLPLETVLGLVRLDAQGRPGGDDGPHRRIMGGPASALGKYARRTARIVRGTLKPADAAKRLAPLFGVTIDEVVAALPPGNVQILEAPEAAP